MLALNNIQGSMLFNNCITISQKTKELRTPQPGKAIISKH